MPVVLFRWTLLFLGEQLVLVYFSWHDGGAVCCSPVQYAAALSSPGVREECEDVESVASQQNFAE